MREIKFRGYSYKINSWLYGNLIEKDDPQKEIKTPWVRLIHDRALTAELVQFDSVGQFTSLKDKNGKDIYEGDILILKYWRSIDGHKFCNDIKVTITFEGGSFWFTGEGYTDCNWHFYNSKDREIIGNIYENPELL